MRLVRPLDTEYPRELITEAIKPSVLSAPESGAMSPLANKIPIKAVIEANQNSVVL